MRTHLVLSLFAILCVLVLNPLTATAEEKLGSFAWYEAETRLVQQVGYIVVTEPSCGASSCSYLMTIATTASPGTIILETRTKGPKVSVEKGGDVLRIECHTLLEVHGDTPLSEAKCAPMIIHRRDGQYFEVLTL